MTLAIIIFLTAFSLITSWMHSETTKMHSASQPKKGSESEEDKANSRFHTASLMQHISVWLFVSYLFEWDIYLSIWAGLYFEVIFESTFPFRLKTTCSVNGPWDWWDTVLVALRDKLGIHLNMISIPVLIVYSIILLVWY